jgi:hypothetical protein
MDETSGITNKKRKRENSSIIWDYYVEKYDDVEKQLYLVCQVCRNKSIIKRYKWTKGASTTTAQGHLWKEHKIDKDHTEEPENKDGDIRDAMKFITMKRQSSLEQSLITFIILDCQPLNILRNDAFRNMLHEFEPGFRIPTEEKCKEMICNSYNWTRDNLKELLKSSAKSINFTTDLWTSRRNDGYIGVTISWIDLEMQLHEALIGIELLPNPHTSENIKNCLNTILENWNLKDKCFAATTDNGANVKKAISLMNRVENIGCAAHTLHLSVTKGLAPIKQFIKRVNNLILFFALSPKQIGRLKEAQNDRGYPKALQIIQDVRTRWNSSYLAWTRLLELKVAIQWLENTLHLAYVKDDKDDGDYLKLIALTESEWTYVLTVIC